MADLVKVVEPAERHYLIKMSQTEVDVIQGIVSDFLDNPERKVYMSYGVDEDVREPSELGTRVLNSVFNGLKVIPEGDNYDYFDYWDVV